MRRRTAEIDFEALVRDHHAAVYRCALRVLRSDADARDAAQEVFLGVLERPERFEEARDARAVLAWTATRTALARLRGERNRRRREDEAAMRRTEADEGTRADRAEEREARGALAKLVDALPDELRIALGLRFEEELTYAAIAEATGCSEPTAHDRVRRALERLRGGLTRAGHASAVPGIAALLGERASAAPGGLEAQLLGLSGAAAPASKWLLAAGLALAAGGTALGVSLALDRGPGEERAALEPPADAGGGTVLALASDADGADASTTAGTRVGTSAPDTRSPVDLDPPSGAAADDADRIPERALTGVVRDADGAPVEGAWVRASTREHRGKMPLFFEKDATDAAGAFALALPVSRPEGQLYDLRVVHEDFVTSSRDGLRVAPDADPDPLHFELLPNTEDAPGEWTLDLYLLDEAGVPVAGAEVSGKRCIRDTSTSERWIVEDRGASDANGRVRLTGARLGEKRLEIDPSRQGWRPREVVVGIDRPGLHERRERLAPGLSVEGLVTTVDGSPIPSPLRIVVTGDDANDWRYAEIAPGGLFRYDGLDAGAFDLRTMAHGWSPVHLRDLAPDGTDLVLELKRADDPRDVGHHMAELHARTFDAATGEPVPHTEFQVEAVRVWEEHERALTGEQLRAVHRTSRPVQRMSTQEEWTEPAPDAHLVGLEAGTYLVAARLRGYAPCVVGPFELDADDVRAGIDLALERGGVLAGRVRRADGALLEDAHVYLAPEGAWGRERLLELDRLLREEGTRALWECDRVDAEGRFRVEHVPTGRPYVLHALARNAAPTTLGRVEWTEEGEAIEREVVLEPR